jgi:single-stranded-DNA-specific exonuclease
MPRNLKEENYSLFKAFEKQVQETIHPDLLLPEIDDAEINFADITPKLTRILKQFEPFGPEYDSCVLTKNKYQFYAKN